MGARESFCNASHVLFLDPGSSYIGVLIWEKFMPFHTYALCAFLSVSYTSIKKLIKALKKIEYVKYTCYLKFSRNVNQLGKWTKY